MTIFIILFVLILIAICIYIFITKQKENINDKTISALKNSIVEKKKEIKKNNKKIKELKSVAEAVKDEKMPETIDDLLNIFPDIDSGL